jgi:hypothetical protein
MPNFRSHANSSQPDNRRRISLRRPKTALLALALVLGLAPTGLILAPEAHAAANPPGCQTVDTWRTYGWGSIVRLGRVHLVAKWCWDDRTVTATFAPYDYFTATNVGSFYMTWKKTSITETWQDPQFGGNWTRDILLQGNIDVSVLKYGHIKTIPVNIDLKLFGDGVYYATGY